MKAKKHKFRSRVNEQSEVCVRALCFAPRHSDGWCVCADDVGQHPVCFRDDDAE